MKSLVSESILELQDGFENRRSNRIRQYGINGTTKRMKIFASDEKDRYLHIYYSPSKCSSERGRFEKKLDKMEEFLEKNKGQQVTIDKDYECYYHLEDYHEGQDDECFVHGIKKEDVISRELQLCGYFCLIASEDMTANEAINLYKSGDASEKLVSTDKTFFGNRSARLHSSESLEGKMLVPFVALIIRNRIYTKIKDAAAEMTSVPSYMNVSAAIKELEKIEMIRQADGIYRLDHAEQPLKKSYLKYLEWTLRMCRKKPKKSVKD